MKDVADLLGVSRSTVSRAISGDPHVNESTRQRVLQAVQDLGFRPNRLAQSLRSVGSSFIGVVVDYMSEITGELVKGVAAVCRKRNFVVALCITGNDPEVVDQWVRENRCVEGLIFLTGGIRELPWSRPASIPSVYGYCFPAGSRDNCVYPDNVEGARAAVEHLIGLGHSRIGYINGPPRWEAHTTRLKGYKEALASAGIAVRDAWVAEGDGTYESGEAAALRLLRLPPDERPTALFACSDRMAIGAIAAAESLGLAVPGDVSIVGYEDREFARYARPPLTTVRLPLVEVGRFAAERLLDGLSTPGAEAWPETRIGCRLVLRQSTAPPRG